MQTPKPAKPLIAGGNNQQTFLYIIIGVAVALVLIFVIISASSTRASFDAAFFEDIPQERLEDGGYILGNPDAAFTLVEFADWYCPHCQSYKPTVNQFIQDFVATGKARLEYRVLETMGASAQPTTQQLYKTLECIDNAKPGSFFYGNELAYELVMSGVRGSEVSSTLAERIGVDYAAMLRCTQDVATQYSSDIRLAQAVGANSTPAIYYRVNGSTPVLVGDRTIGGLTTLVETFGN